jgi:PAS domain S-box-containing protein/putative nucleotidyltransferase with HDIG domain
MQKKLAVLFLEDNQDDVELCLYEFKKQTYEIDFKVVETREAFVREISQQPYDLILADYILPQWNGLEALKWICENKIFTPFILVTGAVGEETAVECIRQGADNYILKDNLARLVPAVEQTLQATQLRQEKLKALKELEESEERLRAIFHSAIDAIFTKNLNGEFTRINQAFIDLVQQDEKNILGRKVDDVLPEPLARRYNELDQQVLQGTLVSQEIVHRVGEREMTLHLNLVPLQENDGKIIGICGYARDISERKNALEKIRMTLEGAIQAMMAIVEQRDPYTSGHQLRVSRLSVAIAQKLGLPADQIEGLRLAAMMHDVGKASLPAELLSKPSKLTEAEKRIIRAHPALGANILRQIPFPWDLARFVEEHHEKLDGSGYPKGLQGDQISLEARIIGVADLVESISSHRPYRPAKLLEEALVDLQKQSGIQYDPKVIHILLELVAEGYFPKKVAANHNWL